jgi:hypothetical protein
MVNTAYASDDNTSSSLPGIKQLGSYSRTEPAAQNYGNEYQCQVSKVQASLLPPWLAVDDGEWRPSGEMSTALIIIRLVALNALFFCLFQPGAGTAWS